ncbi:MAG TPA: HXXEE domain-containing protein [Pyrinomonadaceae bacterium]|nr:HXXEE domain-containing protein [Pyrinomonadaceae bacterium]
MSTRTNSPSAAAINFWSWMFPLTYLIHIAEEYWGGEGYPAYILRLRGVQMSTTRFLVAQGIGFVLVTIGVILARRFNFRQMMLVILGTIVLVNGITHSVTALSIMSYGPGLWSSILVWMPLGIFALMRFRKGVTTKKYWIAVAIGVGVNIVVGILTMRGGRVV